MFEKFLDKLGDRLHIYLNYLYLAVIVIMVTSLARNILKARSASGRIEEARLRVEKLEVEYTDLVSRLDLIQGEEFKERQIREGLGLAKEGEIVMVMPDPEILKSLAPRTFNEEITLPDPNWKKWLNLFF